jgi:hypothetical protein
MYDVETILREQGEMEARRSNWDQLWQEVATLLLPRQADFLLSSTAFAGFNQGTPRTEAIFEETAMLALDHGCAVFEGEVIPQGGTWQRLEARNPDLMKKRHVAVWFEQLGNRLFALRNSPYSRFAIETHESVASLLSFGMQAMTTEALTDPFGRKIGLKYKSEHIGQIYVRGDVTHKKFNLTHGAAMKLWREDQWPPCVRKAAEDSTGKKLNEEATYVQRLAPMPREHYDPIRIDYKGKPIASCIVCVDDKAIVEIGGFRTRPTTVSLYEKSPMEDYGRCPGINVLPSIRAAQEIKRDLVTAINFMARPALGAHDDLLDQLIMYAPGGISYGAIDDRGNPLIKELLEQADISGPAQLLAETQKVIQRAFFEDLYIVRQELKSHISATEQLQRDAQRGIMLAPLKRQESEWFTLQTERELDLMNEMGMLDDMPVEVQDEGGVYQIVYDNPLATARAAQGAQAFYTLLAQVTPLMQIEGSTAIEDFTREYPMSRVLPELGRIHGVPASFSSTDDEKVTTDEQRLSNAKKTNALEVGLTASEIAKNLGGAATPAPSGPAA